MKNTDVQKCAAEHDESEAMAEVKSQPRPPQIDLWVKSDRGVFHRGTKLGISRREIARIAKVFEGEHSMCRAEQHENARADDEKELDHDSPLTRRPGGFSPIDTHV